ncbi:hypothetical protein N8T08_006103 [Aspergillus melleus]|uniref:Uncharacterized protein n=1 Tax=Aspergillus melleus TaxID=138277 RepID=A0ACC3B0F9_9EURO|nr:hypothetical protein N8T08_006103 [Aspergillus melleus]
MYSFHGSTASPASSPPASDISPVAQPDPPANMLHAELFHHLSTVTLPSFCDSGSGLYLSPADMINHGLSTPYLLNELLALAALHLGVLRKDRKDYYRHHSAQLQNHALQLLHVSELDPSGKTSVSAFVFSSILGIHLLCDTLLFRDGEFQHFLDRFIHYLRIHQGVRSVIGGHWAHLKETSLKSVLDEGEASLQRQDTTGTGQGACSHLLARIQAAHLGPCTADTYRQAIEALQRSLAAASRGTAADRRHGALAWPVVVTQEHNDALVHRRPEALVILAHFAALLHACQEMWVFGDGGRFLIESVEGYLGPDWNEWLAWPVQCVAESTVYAAGGI